MPILIEKTLITRDISITVYGEYESNVLSQFSMLKRFHFSYICIIIQFTTEIYTLYLYIIKEGGRKQTK